MCEKTTLTSKYTLIPSPILSGAWAPAKCLLISTQAFFFLSFSIACFTRKNGKTYRAGGLGPIKYGWVTSIEIDGKSNLLFRS
jgi:hypothetical protein